MAMENNTFLLIKNQLQKEILTIIQGLNLLNNYEMQEKYRKELVEYIKILEKLIRFIDFIN